MTSVADACIAGRAEGGDLAAVKDEFVEVEAEAVPAAEAEAPAEEPSPEANPAE